MAIGKNTFSARIMGMIMTLFNNEPFVMDHNTGSSLDERKPVAFSAFTARSSPSMPAVFEVATLLVAATSSINDAISSNIAKNPDAIISFGCKA